MDAINPCSDCGMLWGPDDSIVEKLFNSFYKIVPKALMAWAYEKKSKRILRKSSYLSFATKRLKKIGPVEENNKLKSGKYAY